MLIGTKSCLDLSFNTCDMHKSITNFYPNSNIEHLEYVLAGVLHIMSQSAAGLIQYLPDVAADFLVQLLRIVELGSLELKARGLRTLAALASSDPGRWKASVSAKREFLLF